MINLSKEQGARRKKVLLAALLLSTPGALVTGYAAFSSHSTTQFADFVRRSMELVAMFISWWVFRRLQRNKEIDELGKTRLERTAGLGVAGAMGCSGMVMLVIALTRMTSFEPGGNVVMGLIIALLGALVNGWFWWRYAVLTREQYNSITAAQQKLYFTKALVDFCVVSALAAVVIAPFHPATPFVDLAGSVIVAGYLLWNAISMAQSHFGNAHLAERRVRASVTILRFLQLILPLPLASRLLIQSLPRVRLDAAVRRDAISADGVPCEWIIPQDHLSSRVLLYLHGGGFVFGLTPLHLHMGGWLARKMGIRILMVDYRLAPGHPYPAALNDCVTAYCWLLKQGIEAQNIVVAGDSAGGNLTITSMMRLRDSGIPLPAAAACLSPVTDLTEKGSQSKGFRDPLLPPKAIRFYTNSYVGNNDARIPLISPVFGDLSGLPPLLVHVGEDEILREDAIRIVSRAKADGVDARLEVYLHMWHVWQLYLTLPQAIQSLDDISKFLSSYLAPDKTQSSSG